MDDDRAGKWAACGCWALGLFISLFAIFRGLIAHSIIVPTRHGGDFHAVGEDATVAGIIYLVIGLLVIGVGVAFWNGDIDQR